MNRTRVVSRIVTWMLLAAVLLPAVAHAALVNAVEYVGDHVFLTANPAEIAALDSGRVPGWTRTGLELWTHDAAGPGLFPVCRFYSARFAPRGLHFFTAFVEECKALKTNPDWIEEGVAFYAQMPEAQGDSEFSCPAGTQALHRWYNGGRGGVPLHALTPYGAYSQEWLVGGYLQGGWLSEGLGADSVLNDAWDDFSPGIAFCTVALDSAGGGFDRAKAVAGHLDLVKGTRWNFTSPSGLALGIDFAPTISERSGFLHVGITAGSRLGEASWNERTGQLSVLVYPPVGEWYLYHLLMVGFTGRNLVEGCLYEQSAIAHHDWTSCELVSGSRQ